MSNNWDQFPASNQNSENNGAFPKKSGLLRDYRLQSQQLPPAQPTQSVQPAPPTPMAPPTGSLSPGQFPPSGPLHPSNYVPPTTSQPGAPQQGYPSQMVPPFPPRSAAFSQQWFANTVQTVRRWTGKMAAMANPGTELWSPQPPQPMVPYRPSGPISNPGLTPRPTSLPWKRSLALRLTMHRRHRRERHVGINPIQIATYVGIALLTLIVILLSSTSAYAYSYYQSQLPKLNGLASQQISQTTRIYDRNGVLLADIYDHGDSNGLGGGRRTPISYDDVPTIMQYAMTSAEDPT
ncbi:MAG TPA: hypothetical protein VKR06_04280, partial [Ktedonosporobacter sp.]|nr:hypothetical protein [Ktedonosporobacter sp.]